MSESEIYDNYITPGHPTSFSSPANVHRHYKPLYKRSIIKKTMNNVDSYTLHREYKKPKTRNPFFIYKKREQIQMDLIDVKQLAKQNDGTTFLLVAIDCFTKKAWILPLKKKDANSSLNAIKNILIEMKKQPETIFFDKGTEFKNKIVTNYLNEKNINILHPNTEPKAAIAERFNRSIQDLIYRFLTENETPRYIDKLQEILKAYNNRGHRTIKFMSPNEAEKEENQAKVFNSLFQNYSNICSQRKAPQLQIGDRVRVHTTKGKFTRGYHERFGREHFEIIKVNTQMPIPQYIIKSLNSGHIQKGGFYENELQQIEGDVFKVEKVLKKRKYRGKNQIFVKWRDFNDSHNQWINQKSVTKEY